MMVLSRSVMHKEGAEGRADHKVNDHFLHLSCELVKPLHRRWRDFYRLMWYCRIMPFINTLLASLFSITFKFQEFLVTDTMLKMTDFSAARDEAIIAKAIHKVAHFHQQHYRVNRD